MKTLIVEDDFTSRLVLQELLKGYGMPHIAVNGKEAVEAVRLALAAHEPYNFICLDIMMPEMNGQEALRQIRIMEKLEGISGSNCAKIAMTTALADKANVIKAFQFQCDCFLIKPIQGEKLIEELRRLKLIS